MTAAVATWARTLRAGGIGDATSVTDVVSVTGKECGAEDNSGAATCSG